MKLNKTFYFILFPTAACFLAVTENFSTEGATMCVITPFSFVVEDDEIITIRGDRNFLLSKGVEIAMKAFYARYGIYCIKVSSDLLIKDYCVSVLYSEHEEHYYEDTFKIVKITDRENIIAITCILVVRQENGQILESVRPEMRCNHDNV